MRNLIPQHRHAASPHAMGFMGHPASQHVAAATPIAVAYESRAQRTLGQRWSVAGARFHARFAETTGKTFT